MHRDHKPVYSVDRRRFGRRNTFKVATMQTATGKAQCVVVNLSTGGALLQLRSECAPLETFELHIEEDDILVMCRVVHCTDSNVGVEFIRSPRRASRACKDKSDRIKPFLASIIPPRR